MQVSVENLNFSYKKKKVLEDLNLELSKGEILGVLGINGAGKSTLLKLLCGLLFSKNSQIKYNGEKFSKKVKSQMGVVFQDSSLDQKLTGYENLKLFGSLFKTYNLPKSLENIDLNIPVKNLSGGMKRKLELARVFVHNPKLVFMDEPTVGLDLLSFNKFWEDLRSKQISCLINTHKSEEAEKCDRLIIIHEGKILLSEKPSDLIKRVSGDRISLTAKDSSAAIEIGRHCEELQATRQSNQINIIADNGHKLIPRLVESLPKGFITSIELKKPSLADAFLKVTGEALL